MSFAPQNLGGNYATSRRGGMTTYEVDIIRAQRAKGRSIQTIANMLGRSQCAVAAYVEATEEPAGCSEIKPKAPPKAPEAAMGYINIVARRHGLFPNEVLTPSNRKVGISARHECFSRLLGLRNKDGSRRFSAAQIGSWFDCNHATVIGGGAAHDKRERQKEAENLARWRGLGKVA